MDSRTKIAMGLRIANIRRHRGMTQQHLADATGLTRHVIFHLEHGHTRLDVEQLQRIAAALHCTEIDLRAAPDAPMPRIRLRRREVSDGFRRRSKRGGFGFAPAWDEVRTAAGRR